MNPEKATDYLSRVNWKSLVEWMTAEAILNRPANPVQFCRDLLGEKLADQASQDFKADHVTDWLRGCYTEATALVDEHGVIQGKTLETASASLPEQVTELKRKCLGMNKLMDAASTIATLDPHQVRNGAVCCMLLTGSVSCFVPSLLSPSTLPQPSHRHSTVLIPQHTILPLIPTKTPQTPRNPPHKPPTNPPQYSTQYSPQHTNYDSRRLTIS
jgi:hypothetical protein